MAIYTGEETDGNLIQKNPILSEIEEILEEYPDGFFVKEVENELPFLNTYGNLCHLVTFLSLSYAYIEVYGEKYGDDIVDSYTIPLKELSDNKLEEILEICKEYKKQQNAE